MNENTNDDIQSVQGTTPDFQTEFAKQLSQLAPELVADGKIDGKKLRELLDGDEADDSERFGLFWPGKKRAMRVAQEPTTATLKPAKEESKDWDTTQNLFIEGDNLEVLKVLQKHYHNKIKMIYIDPPYNTGQDFVYPDNFKEGLANYLDFTRQVDEGGRRVSTNSDTDGRYHSNWLNMMYPRLKLARNLLTDDGVIVISIDSNEYDNLRKICNEIFGETNWIGEFVWKRRQNADSRNQTNVSLDHEYILVFARNINNFKANGVGIDTSKYQNPDNDPRGPWASIDLTINATKDQRPNQYYEIVNPANGDTFSANPNRVWSKSRDVVQKMISEGKILFPATLSGRPREKKFLSDLQSDVTGFSTWISPEASGYTTTGTRELTELFADRIFYFPKSVRLTSLLIRQFSSDDSIILDFFSGSGTTAHATMLVNSEDNTNRKHIQVQLPEPTTENSEAHKAGFKTISDISKERIRRAGEKIKADHPGGVGKREELLDVGFKVYRLAESNFTKWQSQSDTDKDSLQQHLLDIRESSNNAATEQDLLTEVLLKQGISLNASISHSDVAGLSAWTVGDNLVCAYLNEKQKPTLDQLRAIAANEPAKLIVLEDAFQGDDELKTNLHQICKSQKIELWTV